MAVYDVFSHIIIILAAVKDFPLRFPLSLQMFCNFFNHVTFDAQGHIKEYV